MTSSIRVAGTVVEQLLSRLTIPDDFARLIYYVLSLFPEPPNEDEAVVRHTVALHQLIERLPKGDVFHDRIDALVPVPYEYRLIGAYHWGFDPPSFERHVHCVAQSGHGKTQLLQRLIYRDLETNKGVCVIAPKGSMLKNLVQLAIIDPERLVYIHPFIPLALNLFRIFGDRPSESQENHIIELVNFAFGSLADAETTSKQTILVTNCVRLLLKVPGASILTLRLLIVHDKLPEEYGRFTHLLNPLTREFFSTQFHHKDYRETKTQLVWRLDKLLSNSRIYRMLSAPRCDFTLDMFTRVVLIDTSWKHMGQDGSTFLGRCFIHLLSIFALTRNDYRQVHCYVDECHAYLTSSVEQILETAREARVSLILAHQQLQQLSTDLEASILTNTAVKFIGKVNASDASKLARELMVEPVALQQQKTFHFYMGQQPVVVEPGFVERQPLMPPKEAVKRIGYFYQKLPYTRQLLLSYNGNIPPQDELWSDIE